MIDRALWLRHGQIVVEGKPEVVTRQYKTEMRSQTQQRTPQHLSQLGQAGVDPLVNHNRFGSLEAEITGVCLQPTSELSAGDTLRVDIEYYATQPIATPIVHLSISCADGKIYFDVNTDTIGLTIPDIKNQGKIFLIIERLDLAKGNYFVNVGIFKADWSYAYDYHWHVYSLCIQSAPVVHSMLAPPYHWHFETDPLQEQKTEDSMNL